MPPKKTYQQVKDFLNNKNLILLSDSYRNSNSLLLCKCEKCNNSIQIRYNDVQQGHGCSICAKVKKHSYEYIKNFCKEKNLSLLSSSYKNALDKLQLKCNRCNKVFYSCFSYISVNKYSCPICSRKQRRKTCFEKYGVYFPAQNKEIALKMAKSSNNSYIFNHWKTKEEIICIGSYEKKVVKFLNENKIDFKWQIPFKMKNDKVYFVDVYLPQKNIYIEIKGYFRKDALEKWNWFHEEYKNSELWDKERLKELRIL